jgi:hypothetical protein
MLSRLRILLFVPLFLLARPAVHAQELAENDYLRHTKVFYLCGFEKECSACYDCGKQKYWVKIKNRADKKITKVSYVFYSDVFNRVLTKDAKMDGDAIDAGSTGRLFICVPDGKHWAISEIGYSDDTKVKFVVKDRLEKFDQEADECDCNKITSYPDPNIR